MEEEKQILSAEDISKLDLTKIESELCRRDFFYFCKEFWETFDPAIPNWEWYHKELCDALQEVGMRLCRNERKLQDVIINQPPGTSKSSIVSVLFNAWLWTVNPKLKIICASYAHAISLDLSTKCKRRLN